MKYSKYAAPNTLNYGCFRSFEVTIFSICIIFLYNTDLECHFFGRHTLNLPNNDRHEISKAIQKLLIAKQVSEVQRGGDVYVKLTYNCHSSRRATRTRPAYFLFEGISGLGIERAAAIQITVLLRVNII